MSVHGFTVYDMIARGAFVHGDAPALIQGERQLSFREFQHQADALAGGLAALGIEKGDRRSEEHTSELQSPCNLVCRLLLEKKKKTEYQILQELYSTRKSPR